MVQENISARILTEFRLQSFEWYGPGPTESFIPAGDGVPKRREGASVRKRPLREGLALPERAPGFWATTHHSFGGPFSAVSTPVFATKYSFCRVFQVKISKIITPLHRSKFKILAKFRRKVFEIFKNSSKCLIFFSFSFFEARIFVGKFLQFSKFRRKICFFSQFDSFHRILI